MSTQTTTPPVKETRILKIDPKLIDPSPFQSRKIFDPAKLEEMMASVREHGIIQPPLVRAGKEPGHVELIVGERRVRACVALALPEIAVLISEVTDAQAEGMVLTENIQREGLTPSEEAHAFDRLLKLRDGGGVALYTREAIAQMIGKDDAYVTARLKLLLCPGALVAAVNDGLVSVSTAMLVGRVPDPKARAECAKLVLKPETQEVPLNYQQTKELVRERFMVKLSKSDFDLDDPNLVPVKLDDGERCQGGACADCPFRSGNMEGIDLQKPTTGEIRGGRLGTTGGADAWLCTLPRCHVLKLDAAWRAKRDRVTSAGGKVLAEAEAKKVFAGHDGGVTWDSKYALTDSQVWLNDRYVKASSLMKGDAAPKTILAQHPETRKVVELVEKADIKAAAAAAAKDDSKQSAAEKRREQERKDERAKELLKQKIEKIALAEGVQDLREAITSGRVKLDERFYGVLFDTALDHAGSDGLKFVADTLEIERDKKASAYGLDKPLKKWAAENCTTVPQLAALTVLTLLGRHLHFQGLDDDQFQAFLGLCGVKKADLERRAKAILETEQKAKGGGKKGAAAATAAKNSTDPVNATADGEASKTVAADKRGKGKERRAESGETESSDDLPLSRLAKRGITVGKPGPEWLEAFEAEKKPGPGMLGRGPKTKGTRGKSANAKDYKAAAEKKEPNTKAGNVWDAWTPQEWKAKAAEVKAGNKKITEFIGATPDQTTPEFIAWTAARVKLYKLAKK